MVTKCESASRCFQPGEVLVGAFFVIVKSSRTLVSSSNVHTLHPAPAHLPVQRGVEVTHGVGADILEHAEVCLGLGEQARANARTGSRDTNMECRNNHKNRPLLTSWCR